MARPGGDRIKELSNTSGTGSFVLAGVVSGEGVRAFSAAEDGQVIRYGAKHVTADEGESGYGVYTHATRTLTRLYRYFPTLGGSAVSFSAGGVHIVCSAISGDFLPNLATVDPTVDDDITSGFLAGMKWINTATPSVWICRWHDEGEADWVRIDGSGGAGTAFTEVDDAGDYSVTSFKVGLNGAEKNEQRRFTGNQNHLIEFIAANLTDGDYGWFIRGGTGAVTLKYNNITLNGGTSDMGLLSKVKWTVHEGGVLIDGGTSEDVDMDGVVVKNAEFRDYKDTVQELGNISGSVTINYALGSVARATLTADLTSLAFSNMDVGATITLVLELGSNSLVDPATTQWPGGAQPDLGTGKVVVSYLKETSGPIYQGFNGGGARS